MVCLSCPCLYRLYTNIGSVWVVHVYAGQYMYIGSVLVVHAYIGQHMYIGSVLVVHAYIGQYMYIGSVLIFRPILASANNESVWVVYVYTGPYTFGLFELSTPILVSICRLDPFGLSTMPALASSNIGSVCVVHASMYVHCICLNYTNLH